MKIRLCWIIIIFSYFSAYGGVPVPQTHQPSLPYFMEQIHFQSILLKTFGENISGLVPDKYSDLTWNPALILNSAENGAYMDFNYIKAKDTYSGYYHNSGYDMVAPNWYSNTYINDLQMDPLYNFAFVHKINHKLAFGLINRSIFDYGPFRSASAWGAYSTGRGSGSYDREAYNELELKTVEVSNNQQSAWGTQTEISLGYKATDKIDLGLKVGHYIFRRNGDLYDSRYSKQPHSFVNEYNKENLDIDGDQLEFGAGLVYHLDEKNDLGFYAALMNGKSTESNASFDRADFWSERAMNTDYYSISEYDLKSNYAYSSDGVSPYFTITFHRKISPKLSLRSFFSYRQIGKEFSSSIFSEDTMYTDRTYDHYHSQDVYYFARDESFRKSASHINGNGEEDKRNYKWFTSLIYRPENEWSAFASLILRYQTLDVSSFEKSTYNRNYDNERYYYQAGTNGQFNSYIKDYQYSYNSQIWSAIIPIGVKANIISGFSLLIGTDLQFELVENSESGDMLYLERISRRTENGSIITEDVETNRPETYRSDQPKEFLKTSNIHFGGFYEHTSGLKIYVRTVGDILEKSAWEFGLEYNF